MDAVRAAAGLPAKWNGAAVTEPVPAQHLLDLQLYLNEARFALQLPGVAFTTPVAPGQPIRAAHIQALRNGVK